MILLSLLVNRNRTEWSLIRSVTKIGHRAESIRFVYREYDWYDMRSIRDSVTGFFFFPAGWVEMRYFVYLMFSIL